MPIAAFACAGLCAGTNRFCFRVLRVLRGVSDGANTLVVNDFR